MLSMSLITIYGNILISGKWILHFAGYTVDIPLTNPGNPESLWGLKNDTMLQINRTLVARYRVKPLPVLYLSSFLNNVKIFPIA